MEKRTLALILTALTLILVSGLAAAENRQGVLQWENGALGQVTQINGNTITIALASMGRSGGGQMPQGNFPSDGNGQMPQGNFPVDGNGQIPQSNSPSDGSSQMPQGNFPSDGSGQVPQGNSPSDGSGQVPQGNFPSDGSGQVPQGNSPADGNGQMPQGNSSSDGQGRGFGGSLTLTGETLTFTVSDTTQITLRGGRGAQDTQGSLSDIQVDSVVTVVLDGETAASIAVRQMTTAPAATEASAGN